MPPRIVTNSAPSCNISHHLLVSLLACRRSCHAHQDLHTHSHRRILHTAYSLGAQKGATPVRAKEKHHNQSCDRQIQNPMVESSARITKSTEQRWTITRIQNATADHLGITPDIFLHMGRNNVGIQYLMYECLKAFTRLIVPSLSRKCSGHALQQLPKQRARHCDCVIIIFLSRPMATVACIATLAGACFLDFAQYHSSF